MLKKGVNILDAWSGAIPAPLSAMMSSGGWAEVLMLIAEVDRRKLYLEHACHSMFDYVVRVLRCSEGVACMEEEWRRRDEEASGAATGRLTCS